MPQGGPQYKPLCTTRMRDCSRLHRSCELTFNAVVTVARPCPHVASNQSALAAADPALKHVQLGCGGGIRLVDAAHPQVERTRLRRASGQLCSVTLANVILRRHMGGSLQWSGAEVLRMFPEFYQDRVTELTLPIVVPPAMFGRPSQKVSQTEPCRHQASGRTSLLQPTASSHSPLQALRWAVSEQNRSGVIASRCG